MCRFAYLSSRGSSHSRGNSFRKNEFKISGVPTKEQEREKYFLRRRGVKRGRKHRETSSCITDEKDNRTITVCVCAVWWVKARPTKRRERKLYKTISRTIKLDSTDNSLLKVHSSSCPRPATKQPHGRVIIFFAIIRRMGTRSTR